jgi:sugar lactone lactonase YvrE
VATVGITVGGLAIALLAACERTTSAKTLEPREIRTWQLPPDGPTLPTPRSVAVGNHDELAVLDTAGRVLLYNADGALKRQWKMLDVSVGKPEGIIILKDGRIVVCDTHYHRIVYFDAEGNWLRNFGQRGRGKGEFEYPVGICKDDAENLYICEYGGNDRVQKFTREGEFILDFGSFGTDPGQFQRPSGLTWHGGKLYVADAINNRVLLFTDAGKYLGLLGAPDKPLAFELPYDITFAPDGNLYVIEYGAGRLSRIALDGTLRGQLGRTGSGAGEFATPWGLTVDSQMRVHVADTKNRRIVTLRL